MVGAAQGGLDIAENRIHPAKLGALDSGSAAAHHSNESNPASLVVGKVYRTVADSEAQAHDLLRVVDECKSEPGGCLYSASMFASIELPEVAKRALALPDVES